MGGEASEPLPSGGSAKGVVAFWSDKRFMRVALEHSRVFRPIVEHSLWGAGIFVRGPEDREGNTWLSDDGVTVVTAREVSLDDDEAYDDESDDDEGDDARQEASRHRRLGSQTHLGGWSLAFPSFPLAVVAYLHRCAFLSYVGWKVTGSSSTECYFARHKLLTPIDGRDPTSVGILALSDIGRASRQIGHLYDSMVRSIEFEVNRLNFVHTLVNMKRGVLREEDLAKHVYLSASQGGWSHDRVPRSTSRETLVKLGWKLAGPMDSSWYALGLDLFGWNELHSAAKSNGRLPRGVTSFPAGVRYLNPWNVVYRMLPSYHELSSLRAGEIGHGVRMRGGCSDLGPFFYINHGHQLVCGE